MNKKEYRTAIIMAKAKEPKGFKTSETSEPVSAMAKICKELVGLAEISEKAKKTKTGVKPAKPLKNPVEIINTVKVKIIPSPEYVPLVSSRDCRMSPVSRAARCYTPDGDLAIQKKP